MNSSSKISILMGLIVILLVSYACNSQGDKDSRSTKTKAYRVVISTDIGGTDPDDFQSMVHLLLYADVLEIEGLISSPFGPGSKEDILKVIDQYEKDYPNLVTYSDRYPTADSLRSITKQGGIDLAEYKGYGNSTEGSEWLIKCARRNDPRPLYVLVWGGIEDLAQALHDAPDILPKLRVHWIGGPNKKWSTNAYQYIVDNHPNLWIIESNATYRGFFNGGNQTDEWSNSGFPKKHIDGKGAMGDFFMTQLGGKIKMGDTPAVTWLLNGNPENPALPGWGGQYVRAWERPYYLIEQMPEKTDSIQEFAILEFALQAGTGLPDDAEARLNVDNQSLKGYFMEDGTVRFRFSPKSSKTFDFEIESNLTGLNGQKGSVTAYIPNKELASEPSVNQPNWWTDDPNPEFTEGGHIGAKTVNQWRVEFLTDFAERIDRCQTPYKSK